ncbi:uncharacterized protein LOC130614098 [Hydractinia symbiolongicarpus]|uniref:uncharacterized protein LOC130614098 n=1 Tax=Hydractinia symbiolongicarpus TaxID=13093 RepID=UPI00254FEE6A|nr:uncharacterized protein LOC130614098 [Hydractinia symbiolongicarpus]
MYIIVISCLLLSPSLYNASDNTAQDQKIIKELESILQKNVKNQLFDGAGSIDVTVWKRNQNQSELIPIYLKSFGKSQVANISKEIVHIKTRSPWNNLKDISNRYLPAIPDVDGNMYGDAGKRNQYRIASNTKTFIGIAADMLAEKHGLNLDEKLHPKYVNLSTLGLAHKWNIPSEKDGYLSDFPNSSKYMNAITFRHLLTHTSGLSRESKKGSQYSYGSSRTSTSKCPPNDEYQGLIDCVQTQDNNWPAWTQHVVSYMMPSCGYKGYNEMSKKQKSCLPGEYFHYSNAGYSILGLGLDSFVKKKINHSFTITTWITEKIFKKFDMNETVFTWVDYNQEQKGKTTHGCQGGEELSACNQTRALMDYADRGIKTPPGGIWSTTVDLAKYLLNLHTLSNKSNIFEVDPNISPKTDSESEEDPTQMPSSDFKYGHGWYIAEQYSCLPEKHQTHIQGAWGTVPGFTSYMITNSKQNENENQYVIVMLRSYNYGGRFNLGNQARRFLWRLLHPEEKLATLKCPVVVKDDFSEGDLIVQKNKRSSNSKTNFANRTLLLLFTIMTVHYCMNRL